MAVEEYPEQLEDEQQEAIFDAEGTEENLEMMMQMMEVVEAIPEDVMAAIRVDGAEREFFLTVQWLLMVLNRGD